MELGLRSAEVDGPTSNVAKPIKADAAGERATQDIARSSHHPVVAAPPLARARHVVSQAHQIVHVIAHDGRRRSALAGLIHRSQRQPAAYISPAEFLLSGAAERPGCILLEAEGSGASGLDLQDTLHRRGAAVSMVFLVSHADVPTSVRAMKGGAVDFLVRPVADSTLLDAVQRALELNAAERELRAYTRALRTRYGSLTRREREVFLRVVVGRLNKQIAADLGAAERTVKAHRARVMAKMQVKTLADLVRLAGQLEMLEPELIADDPSPDEDESLA